ncbi:MAG TPA: DUF4384 domain-containing protein [Blastocatellia bacterium]|nr:DUF4384 domain-containing protein [Blastocatellia bacterium]
MRSQIKFAVALLVASGQLLGVAAAQDQTALRQRGIQLKEDYKSGKVDGMRVLVLKSEGGNFLPVDPGRIFTQGDEIRVAFESNFDGYVYIVNVSPDGKKRVIFPGLQATNSSNAIRARQQVELPRTSFIFDKETGTEILQVIMSREPIAVLDAAVKESKGELQSASSAAAELSASAQRGIVSDNVSSVLGQQTGIRARGVFLAAGKDNDKTGSVVAIADEKRSDARLKSGEVASFEIRLQHN